MDFLFAEGFRMLLHRLSNYQIN